ncbi:MAG: protoporphyrinogen oxidase HemJ [Helicobacteraceae bacterium]|jgi:putative membrane protein|nr:protoporphyrinogen oxidase HemJ [Helicobacteraceae bacterium]
MIEYYLAFKTIHIIAMTAWFAAMFYLPRLFVYHAENRDVAEFTRIVKIQELKLWKYIALPAFWTTLISGLTMIVANTDLLSVGWFHAKLTLAAALIGLFFYMGHLLKQLQKDMCAKSGAFFRFFNEIPTLFLIAIVTLAIIKPF